MSLFIGDNPAPSHQSPPGWIWLKPTEIGVEVYSLSENKEWELKLTLSLSTHSHPTHGDINFTGTISADGEAGITGERTLPTGHVLTFKEGLLVGFQAP